MSQSTRLPLAPWAASSIEIYAEDYAADEGDYHAPAYRALADAFRFERKEGSDGSVKEKSWLEVTPDNASALLDALTNLANVEDETADQYDPEGQKFARWSRDGLTAASTKLVKIIKGWEE